MSPERWEETVRRLERKAEESPGAYRLRVGLLAALGYGYLAFVALLLVGGAAAVVVLAIATSGILIKFALPLLAIAYTVVRSAIGIRIPAPEGVELSRKDAPQLWEVIDRTRKRLRAPRVSRLVVDEQMNAGVVQVPRARGLLGQANHLVLGLPLLQALGPDEFEAVLAHELGHLSGNHSRFAGRIYRLRKTWVRLLEALEQRDKAGIGLFRRFFEWYAPYFSAYSFALARQDEYVADRAAAEAVGAPAAGLALARVDLAAWEVSRWWPKVFSRVQSDPQPPRTAFTDLRTQLPVRHNGDLDDWLKAALAVEGDLSDTHPSLRDRLAALGVEEPQVRAGLDAPPQATAAAALLGPTEDALVQRFDAEWTADVAPAWSERHAEARQARERLQELDGRRDSLGVDERLELATLTEDLEEDPALALARYEEVLAADPGNAPANFRSGALLLERGDESGVARVEAAMDAEHDAVLPGCELLATHFDRQDRSEDAQRYVQRAQAHLRMLDEAQAEREAPVSSSELEPHGLDSEQLAAVQAVLAQEPKVRRAWLVRRRLEHLADKAPAYVMCVRGRGDKEELAGRLADALPLPQVLVLAPGWWPFGEWRRVMRTPGAEIPRH